MKKGGIENLCIDKFKNVNHNLKENNNFFDYFHQTLIIVLFWIIFAFLKNCKGGYFLFPVINVIKAEVIYSFGGYQAFEEYDFRNGISDC